MFCAKNSRKVKLAGKEHLGPAAYFGENEATKRSDTENKKKLAYSFNFVLQMSARGIRRKNKPQLVAAMSGLHSVLFYYISNAVWLSTLEIRQN